MRLRFLGAAREVTGSLHLLELDQGTLAIDCGLYQGRREEARRRNRELPAEAVAADALLLTHAHIDHSGALPVLVKSGFRGTIHATPATRDLAAVMLRDSARIQAADAEYLNRKWGGEPGYRPILPLYDEDDAIRCLRHFVGVPYHREFRPLPGVTAWFLDAGHILGSAQIVLDVEERGVRRRLLFSGDLGRRALPILRDPEPPPPGVDHLVLESTYGDRDHPPLERRLDELERVLRDAVARGGKIIVPAFAVGRTQELMFALNQLFQLGRLPRLPVFVDSPLALDATAVYRLHPDCFDDEVRAFQSRHGDAFGFEGATYVQSREESLRLNHLAGPAVIISAAGMAEAGRVLHHLRRHVEDPRATIVIVGFMAQHTLGRRLAERRPRVKIWGVERELRARVEVLASFSAHAGQSGLLAHVAAAGGALRRCFLVHGEPPAQAALAEALRATRRDVVIPERGDVVELT